MKSFTVLLYFKTISYLKDAHCAELDFDEKTGLFGVFDGHGGKIRFFQYKYLFY